MLRRCRATLVKPNEFRHPGRDGCDLYLIGSAVRTFQNSFGMNRRARRELRVQNDEGAEGGGEITRSGARLPRW